MGLTIYEQCLCRDYYTRFKNPDLPIKVRLNQGFLEREDVIAYLNIIEGEEKMHKLTNYISRPQAADVR